MLMKVEFDVGGERGDSCMWRKREKKKEVDFGGRWEVVLYSTPLGKVQYDWMGKGKRGEGG